MEVNVSLQKVVPEETSTGLLLNAPQMSPGKKTGRGLKKLFFITSFAVIVLLFNGCMAGYIANEPVYVEYARPASPGNTHVWIDGGWAWDRPSHMYVQRTGYWERPNQRKEFIPGHWQADSRGRYWVRGRWQKQKKQRSNGWR